MKISAEDEWIATESTESLSPLEKIVYSRKKNLTGTPVPERPRVKQSRQRQNS